MRRAVAVEDGVSAVIREALEKDGFIVVSPGAVGQLDATIISGMDANAMGMQDISGNSVVINAAGKTPEQVLSELKKRV